MHDPFRLKLMSVFFAVFWTGWMVWWTGRYELVHVLMLAVSGSLAALFWYFAMRWWFRWTGRRQS